MDAKTTAVLETLKANWKLKILALLLATLTFHAIRGVTGYEVEYEVPLQVAVEAGIAVLNQTPSSVVVRFRGAQDDLLRLNQKLIKAVVSVRGGEPDGSEKRVPIRPQDVQGIAGVRVMSIVPPDARLTFDREIEMICTVAKPETTGTPMIGKAEVEYAPHTVRVRGPRGRLEEMERSGHSELSTEAIDIDGRAKSFSRQVRILPPVDTWISKIDPELVTAQVNFVTRMATKSWDSMPVLVMQHFREGVPVTVDPPEAAVSLEGQPELLDKMTNTCIRIFVDASELVEPGSYTLPLSLYCPLHENLNATLTPSNVTVTVVSP